MKRKSISKLKFSITESLSLLISIWNGDVMRAKKKIGDHLDDMLMRNILDPKPDGSSALIIVNIFHVNPQLKEPIMMTHRYYEWRSRLNRKRFIRSIVPFAFSLFGL